MSWLAGRGGRSEDREYTETRVSISQRLAPIVGIAGWSALSGCALVENYDDPNGPRYAASYSTDHDLPADEVTLATFNVEFGEHVSRAVRELRENPELARAGVLLLQEMDPDGVDTMARELGYDYVYYPGSVHHGKDFGNAVLSRWAIESDEKLILPHRNPTNGRIRIAVGATLGTPRDPLVVFSVHSDTPWLGPRARLDQARAVVEAAERSEPPVAVGGDFNTLESAMVEETAREFERAGYDWVTAELPATAENALGGAKLDHVFVKGLDALAASTEATEASDHRPVWVTLRRTASP
jgi:endonuclease/exonuclease/phosphatase family metal-dependent hydrolase